MKLKYSVKFSSPDQAMSFAAMVANSIFTKYGFDFIVTSANDGVHSTGSLHYKNSAFDCRTKHIPDIETKEKIVKEIRESLTDDFDVLFEYPNTENQHIHIEHDPD